MVKKKYTHTFTQKKIYHISDWAVGGLQREERLKVSHVLLYLNCL